MLLVQDGLFLLSLFQILICNEVLNLFPFFFQPLKKVCFQTEILGNLFKYICFCFILLFTSSSPCRKDQFAISYFSTSLIVLIRDQPLFSFRFENYISGSRQRECMRTAKIGPDLRLTTGRYGTTHQFVAVDLPTFYELFWAACAKTLKKKTKQKTPPQDLPLNQRRLWGKLQVSFRKRQDLKIIVLEEVHSVFHCISGPFAHVKLQFYPFNDKQELVCYL